MIDAFETVDAIFNMYRSLKRSLDKRRVRQEVRGNKANINTFLGNINSSNSKREVKLEYSRDSYSQAGFTQRTESEGTFEASLQMYSLRFKTQSVFGPESNVFIRESSFYFYPQDFLTMFKELEFRKQTPVGYYGFMLTCDKYFSPGINVVGTASIQRGIVCGRVGLMNGYEFDNRAKECFLQISRPDLPVLNFKGEYVLVEEIASYINANKHPEKYSFEF